MRVSIKKERKVLEEYEKREMKEQRKLRGEKINIKMAIKLKTNNKRG